MLFLYILAGEGNKAQKRSISLITYSVRKEKVGTETDIGRLRDYRNGTGNRNKEDVAVIVS